MKAAYAIAFSLVGACVFFCTAKAGKYDTKIARTVKKLLECELLAILMNVLIVLTTDYSVCMAAYSVLFACLDWLLFCLLRFSCEFAGRGLGRPGVWYAAAALTAVDSLAMLGNYFGNYAFFCQQVPGWGGEPFYKPVYTWVFNVHLALGGAMALASVLALLYKAYRPGEIYRGKYLLILLALGLTAVCGAAYVYADAPVDLSVAGYGVCGIMIFFYAVVFEPRELVRRTLTRVVKEMPDAVFVLDDKGSVVHCNDRAEKLLEQEKLGFQEIQECFLSWKERHEPSSGGDESFPLTRQHGDRKMYYSVYHGELHSNADRYLGCFFVVHDRTEEYKNRERERYAATRDELTGLYNRQYFFHKVKEQLDADPGREYLIVCSDVYNFKLINDVFGTWRGDALLKRIADELRNQTVKGEIYGRLERDRFGLLMLKENYSEEVFAAEAQRLLYLEDDISYPVQVCIGVYEVRDRTLPVAVMCDRANLAINTIKGKFGRDVAYYDHRLRDDLMREQELAGELPEAIEKRQFEIHLQPQVDAEGRILGAEALVRWNHPLKGRIGPGDFISVFEKNGQIVDLDRYVWELACMQLQKWKMEGRDHIYLSVNISPKDFFFLDIHKVFTELVEKYEIDPACLKLEITETAVMTDMEKQLKLIDRLREAGFVVEMDDFGSGYSSLNMLKNIQVDVLKIDMAFLGKADDEFRARVILRAIVELSRQLQIPVVTEGVETEEQVLFLKEIGCGIFQGYYFAQPMEVSAFEDKYMQYGA